MSTEGRIIPLTRGFFAIVDEEDYERVSQFRWNYGTGGYARRTVRMPDGKTKKQYLSRFIMGEPPEMLVDHRSRNTLDDRKKNLRVATKSQNGQNRQAQKNNKCGLKGVFWNKVQHAWVATICVKGKRHHMGSFKTAEAAHEAYKAAALKFHGEFACVESSNVPEQRLSEPMARPNKISNTSGVEGVSWTNSKKAWRARIQINKLSCYLGIFRQKEDAMLARKRAEAILPSLDHSTLTGGLLRAAIAESAGS